MKRNKGHIFIMGFLFSIFVFGNFQLPGEEIQTTPYMPLIYEVLFPPIPVKSEGRSHLVYELHLTNFSRREVTLHKIEVLKQDKRLIKAYEGDRLTECLTRPGKPLDVENKLTLEGGARAVLFVMASFEKSAEIPDILTHRVSVEYLRGTGERVLLQGEGAQVTVVKKAPLVIGPPVRPGVWLAGNCPGDGPGGHRLSMQPWNGKLVVNERYAIDFMKFGNDGRLVHRDHSINADWHGYGEEVIAVAAGVVSDCKDGIIENTPLSEYAVPNTLEFAAGNYVILNIGQGLYVVYAHLKPKSLKVKVGDQVHKGQVLGLVGNSGISDAPHLHFHIIDSNSVFGGEGLPFVFEQFELMGRFDQMDDNLDKSWSPTGESSMRYEELPMRDVVIKFPKAAIAARLPLKCHARPGRLAE